MMKTRQFESIRLRTTAILLLAVSCGTAEFVGMSAFRVRECESESVDFEEIEVDAVATERRRRKNVQQIQLARPKFPRRTFSLSELNRLADRPLRSQRGHVLENGSRAPLRC